VSPGEGEGGERPTRRALAAGRARHASRSVAWIGPACAIVGTLGFSAKAILIKLAYAASTVDAITLLALRMLYSAPFFVAMAWWSGRAGAPLARRDWLALAGLGFLGYYLASLLDFLGLRYVSASLERLVLYLYPTIVVLLSAAFLGKPVTRRAIGALALSYAGIALVFRHDVAIAGDGAATLLGGTLVFGSALCYAVYLVAAGGVIRRSGSMRFIALAMLVSTLFVLVHFALARPLSALDVPPAIHALSLVMAIGSTVVPTWLVAEAVRRIGANATSLVGSLGPVFTIALGAWLLAEPVHAIQLGGAALVLAGVALVTMKTRATDASP
jgi:drug/metabolite transporter (DMT)-like permease